MLSKPKAVSSGGSISRSRAVPTAPSLLNSPSATRSTPNRSRDRELVFHAVEPPHGDPPRIGLRIVDPELLPARSIA